MNRIPHTAPDSAAAVEAQAVASLEDRNRKLHAKKGQKSSVVFDNAGRKQACPVVFLGIDPGATGCAALIHEGGHDLFDWPGDPALVVPRWRIGWPASTCASPRWKRCTPCPVKASSPCSPSVRTSAHGKASSPPCPSPTSRPGPRSGSAGWWIAKPARTSRPHR